MVLNIKTLKQIIKISDAHINWIKENVNKFNKQVSQLSEDKNKKINIISKGKW